MADAKASFAVELEDGVSKGANSGARSLEKLKKAIQDDQKALRDMQGAMGRLKGNTTDVTKAKSELQKKIDATKGSLGKAQAQYLQAGGQLSKLGEKAKGSSLSLSNLKTIAAGSGAAVAALVAIVAGAIVAFVGFGIAVADAARSSKLLLEAQTGSSLGADRMNQWVNAISRKVPLARAQIRDLVGALTDKGLQGNKLAHALSATATATAVLGSSAGSKIQAIAEQAVRARRLMIGMFDLQGTGVNINDVAAQLATIAKTSVGAAKAALQNGRVEVETGLKALDKAIESKLGGIAKKQMKSLPMQFEKAKEKFQDLFSGVRIEKLLDALDQMLGLLDQNTSSGQALKQICEGIIQPMVDAIGFAMPFIKQFFRGFLIGALQAGIVFLDLGTAIKVMIPKWLVSDLGSMTTALEAGKIAAYALAVVVGLLAAAVALAAAPIVALAAGIYAAIKAYEALKEVMGGKKLATGVTENIAKVKENVDGAARRKGFKSAVQGGFEAMRDPRGKPVASASGNALGDAMATGMAQGLRKGTDKVREAASEMGKAAHDATKKAVDAHSPSRLFFKTGGDIATGLAQGVDHGSSKVNESVYSLVTPADAKAVSSSVTNNKTSAPTQINHFYGMGAQDREWFERKSQAGLSRSAQMAGS
jgi:hypothetical protein